MNLKLTQPTSYLAFRKKMARLAHENYREVSTGYNNPPQVEGIGPYTAGFLGLYANETPQVMSALLTEAQVDGLFVINEDQDEYTFRSAKVLGQEYEKQRIRFLSWFVPFLVLLLLGGVIWGVFTQLESYNIAQQEKASQLKIQEDRVREQLLEQRAVMCVKLLGEYDRATDFIKPQVQKMLSEASCPPLGLH